MNDDPDKVVYFNNCHSFDHEGHYGSGAFFDLGTTGRQTTQATGLKAGQICVVGSITPSGQIAFNWYTFAYESVLDDKDSQPGRVFFGNLVASETLTKQKAARSVRYRALFTQNGRNKDSFKIGSVFHGVVPQDERPKSVEATGNLPDEMADEKGASQLLKFVVRDGDDRKRVARQICERRGQPAFRNDLRKRYGDRCLVTGCKVLAVLEAAHIKPYQGEKDNHSENGLLLRADIHTLFDLDLLGIEPKSLRVELHPSLAGSAAYKNLAGKTLRCSEKQRPSKDALKLRYEKFKERMADLP